MKLISAGRYFGFIPILSGLFSLGMNGMCISKYDKRLPLTINTGQHDRLPPQKSNISLCRDSRAINVK